jgi:NarL family two-component system response regulator YdfI
MKRVRVLVVAEDPDARSALAAKVSQEVDLDLVGDVSADALETAVAAYDPHIILWDADASLAGAPVEPILPETGSVPFIAVTQNADSGERALRAGARGYLHPQSPAETFAAAIMAAAEGLLVMDPTVAEWTREGTAPIEAAPDDLTPREMEVLYLLAEGLSNKEIARRLGISDHTVKTHVDAILSKLDAHSRTEAVTRAARLGVIPL